MNIYPVVNEFEKAILEIGAGAWFLTSASLVLVFGWYLIQRILWDDAWLSSPTVRAAFALSIFGIGSCLRAGLAWYRFSHNDFQGSAFIASWWPWFEVSIILNAIGAAVAVYVLSPGYRNLIATLIVGGAFLIPTIIYLV